MAPQPWLLFRINNIKPDALFITAIKQHSPKRTGRLQPLGHFVIGGFVFNKLETLYAFITMYLTIVWHQIMPFSLPFLKDEIIGVEMSELRKAG